MYLFEIVSIPGPNFDSGRYLKRNVRSSVVQFQLEILMNNKGIQGFGFIFNQLILTCYTIAGLLYVLLAFWSLTSYKKLTEPVSLRVRLVGVAA